MAQQVSGLPDLPTQARVDNEAIVQDVALSLQLHPALVQPDCETPYASIEDAVDRLLPYHMFADDDDESADLRESLGLDWQTEPGPLLCSSRQIVQTLLQEKAKDYVYRSAALARKFAAVEEQSRVLRANHTLPEDGLRMEREQMESARNTWHREMLVWDETIAQCDQAQKAHEQKKNAAAMAAAHAARAGQAGVSAPGVGQMAYTAYRPQMPGTQPGAPFMYLPTTGPTSTPQQFYYPMMPGAGAPQVMMPAQLAQYQQQLQQQQQAAASEGQAPQAVAQTLPMQVQQRSSPQQPPQPQ